VVSAAPRTWRGQPPRGSPRVLLVRSSPRMGGLERALLALATGLQHRGWDVVVALISRTEHHPLTLLARKQGIPVHLLPDPSPWSWRPIRALLTLLRTGHPQIVYTWDYRSNILVALAKKLLSLSAPIVFSAHGYTDANWRQRLYRDLDIAVLKRSRAVVVPSPVMERYLVARGKSPNDVYIIPPAVDWTWVDRWARMRLAGISHPTRAEPRLLVVGRLSVEKGVDRLIAALPRALRAYPRLTLWILGDGPERHHLERQVVRHALEGNVRFWGWRVNPFPFMQVVSGTVIPSRRESFGLVALEVQGTGGALLATDVGHLPSLVRPPNLLLPDTDDPSQWAEALVAFIRAASNGVDSRRRIQAWVRATFPLERAVELHHRLFWHLVDGVGL